MIKDHNNKRSKIAMVTINGSLESGTVVQENTYTVHLKFKMLPKEPVIKVKKNRARLILGDVWDK